MFAQTFPMFQDSGKFRVDSTYNKTIYFVVSLLSLLINAAVLCYMIYKVVKTKKNPYTSELYSDLEASKKIKELAV